MILIPVPTSSVCGVRKVLSQNFAVLQKNLMKMWGDLNKYLPPI